jgi:hypothetical protein
VRGDSASRRNDIVADPKFVWPQWQDYRLAKSFCHGARDRKT